MMGDNANTKHGNMVALGPFTASINLAAQTDALTAYSVRFGLSASDYAWHYITAPFSGHIVALSSSGDYPATGTWSIAAVVNGTVRQPTRLPIVADAGSLVMNSAQSVAFSAGDSLGIAYSTSGDFANGDGGYSVVYLFVMFSNV